jgi:DNA-binding CsgD family transcriptional regulator
VIAPLRKGAIPDHCAPLAVLLATDPDATVTIQRGALCDLYGMTGAEADVAAMLAEGLSPDEIAQTLGVSMNTIRTHMKRAFEKTCVGRQADLVRVLLNNPIRALSPVAPPQRARQSGSRGA